ncbi:hypothetical protein ACFR9U_17225 [Halorientalis brevis]|uniref:Uncharacterized protein n=1 Tax=Halorientalis brevis TaxID=1126241 RepID=A0ABD6CFX3_9EURY|nr:hypothetical protein [Halorientalis brevis]
MIETATFVSGVGVLVALDLAVLGVSVQNARKVGTDKEARETASTALKTAREAKREAKA